MSKAMYQASGVLNAKIVEHMPQCMMSVPYAHHHPLLSPKHEVMLDLLPPLVKEPSQLVGEWDDPLFVSLATDSE